MIMREIYNEVEFEVIRFPMEDVIVTSGGACGPTDWETCNNPLVDED